ncbi:hypothetical protein BJ508DRAFT_414900 [Ascobolus immersus RN42]|uniref:DNA-directed RNA polymerase III subunit RPC3 n=1 Tax=Ascobolus immersus RN42 TaxID=1160509 RepID=A0A3N4I9A9_ASCIM|nr:hypothetical protein BJ508DRAFT_414900 [Ascobolus immersus RN42]
MSQKNSAELCTLLVKEIYGDVSSKVTQVLLQFGRLPLPLIVRYSKLPEKIVKQTLVVLIQQHLVCHALQKEGQRMVTYYECDWLRMYYLLESGRIIQVTEERYGEEGASIINNFLQLGHARVSDFLAAYGTSTLRQARVNGAVNENLKIAAINTLKAKLGELYKARFLVQVKEQHMRPHTDLVNDIKADLRRQFSKETAVESRLNKLILEHLPQRLRDIEVGDVSPMSGMKRKGGGAPEIQIRPIKRQKKAADLSYIGVGLGDDDDEYEIDEEIVLRVNYDKFLVLFRNDELVALAKDRMGETTSLVYREVLKAMESKVLKCRDPMMELSEEQGKKLKVSTLELSRTFPDSIELEGTIADAPKAKGLNGSSSKSKKRKVESDEEPDAMDLDSDDDDFDISEDEDEDDMNPKAKLKKRRMAIMKQHLELLAQSSIKFVRLESTKGAGEWSVNYKELMAYMRQLEIEKIVEERFGIKATRLLRICDEKGKLEEKQLAAAALTTDKDIRAELGRLHAAGHLFLQELPRTADRAASRTVYLWYFDREKARQSVLHDIYKGMSRAIQRIESEAALRSTLIAKVNRTDIAEGEEGSVLSTTERKEWERWRQIQAHMWAQVERMDRQVLILRDF